MTPREGTGRLRVTRQLLDELLSAENYHVEGALPPDAQDERDGTLSLAVCSRVLPTLEKDAPLPEVVCHVTEHRRQSTISPFLPKEPSP